MKTNIGGDRIGSGQKQEVSLRNYERSTHDLSYIWRSSMSAGTLVPFMNKIGLPGDVFNIKLSAETMTLPTIGPLFGSYKVQCDIFEVPLRLYNAKLHMNKLGIGMDMSNIYLPQITLKTNNHASYIPTHDDNEHVHSSCLMKYLGISGLGEITGTTNPATRDFNATPLLAYWDIFKNYYANKQEDKAYYIHTDTTSSIEKVTIDSAILYDEQGKILGNVNAPYITETPGSSQCVLKIKFPEGVVDPKVDDSSYTNQEGSMDTLLDMFNDHEYDVNTRILTFSNIDVMSYGGEELQIVNDLAIGVGETNFDVQSFNLDNIDTMRDKILQYTGSDSFEVTTPNLTPYNCFIKEVGTNEDKKYGLQFNQEGLGLKTYQSDLFNNWMNTEFIDGTNGVNEVSAVSTTGDEFTIDALNLAQKVYVMLNRIAISGGTYDDWLDAVYTHERVKGVESPVYHGSLIKELMFEEVISQSETENEPLGTLAGRGRLTDKNKGGQMQIKCNEPCIIMGIVSLTPRVEYSQGNDWKVNLKSYEDFHKPALDAIGFQDLITEQMLYSDTILNSDTGEITQRSLGKQPAWINYMSEVNRVYGNFAEENKEMFMTLNRRYEREAGGDELADGTTYIDPKKFNHIFAETKLDAQNFWMQIGVDLKARRKMSAKVIPNL